MKEEDGAVEHLADRALIPLADISIHHNLCRQKVTYLHYIPMISLYPLTVKILFIFLMKIGIIF